MPFTKYGEGSYGASGDTYGQTPDRIGLLTPLPRLFDRVAVTVESSWQVHVLTGNDFPARFHIRRPVTVTTSVTFTARHRITGSNDTGWTVQRRVRHDQMIRWLSGVDADEEPFLLGLLFGDD